MRIGKWILAIVVWVGASIVMVVSLGRCMTNLGTAPVPTPDASLAREFVSRHDETASDIRELVRSLKANRTVNLEWAETSLTKSISPYGMNVLARENVLEILQEIYASGELNTDVQAELQIEKSLVELSLISLGSDILVLEIVTQGDSSLSGFNLAAQSAMSEEKTALQALMDFYASDDFVKKGIGTEAFISALSSSYDRLLEAMVLWEAAKLRLQNLK